MVITLVLLTSTRVLFMLWQHDRVESIECVKSILLGGLRMDLILVAYVVAPAVLVSLFFGGAGTLGRFAMRTASDYLALLFTVIVVMEIVTPRFILEYDSRPNRLFIEYLVHPKEIFSMLWVGYRMEFVGLIVALVTIGAVSRRMYRWRRSSPVQAKLHMRAAACLAVAPALFLCARSSLKHRPANPSCVVFSSDHLLNDLCLSSSYSVLYAITQLKGEADAASVYGSFASDQEVIDEVRRSMVTVPDGGFVSDAIPTLHEQTASRERDKPLNLVIILEESLGAQYVEALGGRPVTRFLDTLKTEGWWFEQMYATGTRSVRGIEAVVSGFLPTPGRSVVKLGFSQTGFFTLASFLGDHGYRTQFVYGGESHFDNMKSFFSGNGFQEIIDQDDYEDPIFSGSWGVCDEDILLRAHASFLEAGEQPFFSLVFSVSNHSPWEYPEDTIEHFNSPATTVENTVRYADHALEQFFFHARQAPYWENTVFVVVADHDSRVHGASLVPIERFHIPAVIMGPGIEPFSDSRITSQIDLGPTLLSLIGVSGVHPMFGNDLTCLPQDDPGRAIMQYGQNQAYRRGDQVVIQQPHLDPKQFRLVGQQLEEVSLDPELELTARAHAQLPSLLYRKRLYTVPENARPAGAAQK